MLYQNVWTEIVVRMNAELFFIHVFAWIYNVIQLRIHDHPIGHLVNSFDLGYTAKCWDLVKTLVENLAICTAHCMAKHTNGESNVA